MTNHKLLEQFRSFYFRNYPDDMERQINYFSIFGGLGVDVDTTLPLEYLVEKIILENFDKYNDEIENLTLDNSNNQRLLRALAVGDRRIFSAFNRAGLNNGNGGGALNYLQDSGLIQIEFSREEPAKSLSPNGKLKKEIARHRISHKVLFTFPFVRFWFYFIYPHVREIKEGNYEKLFQDFVNKHNSYTSLVFEELSEVLLNYNLRDAQILSSGSYWDANIEIDILTVTNDERVYVGECKWTNHQVNMSEFHKLRQKCEQLDVEPYQVILFSKRGFSKELKNNEGKELRLYSSKDFEALVKSTSKSELIENFFN